MLWTWNCFTHSANQNRNNFTFATCTKHVNQQRINGKFLTWLKKQWICIVFFFQIFYSNLRRFFWHLAQLCSSALRARAVGKSHSGVTHLGHEGKFSWKLCLFYYSHSKRKIEKRTRYRRGNSKKTFFVVETKISVHSGTNWRDFGYFCESQVVF